LVPRAVDLDPEEREGVIGISLSIPLHPFPAAQNPGHEHVGQALRFCLSDLVRMKDVPARPQPSALDFGLDLGQQTLNTKGAGDCNGVRGSTVMLEWSSGLRR
jgi:hypothetical protein